MDYISTDALIKTEECYTTIILVEGNLKILHIGLLSEECGEKSNMALC